MALVCQQFTHLSQPFIFSRFHFGKYTPQNYVGKLEKDADRLERLLTILQQKPDYRRWLKVLRFRFLTNAPESFRYSQGPQKTARMERLAEQLFLQLMDVRSLTLSGMPISPNLYCHICSIPTLQIVHLRDIPQPEFLHSPTIPPVWPALPIRELTVLLDNRSMAVVNTKALFMLSLAPQLKSLNTTLWVLASNYAQHTSISWAFVTDLTLRASETAPELGRVLKAFPSLRRLSLRVTSCARFAPLQEECVPVLTDFSGPWRLACSIIPGRPIQKASLELEDDMELSGADMAFLLQGTAKLEHLELRSLCESRENMEHITALLPDLKSLSLDYWLPAGGYLGALVEFVSSGRTMPQLKHLRYCTLSTFRRLPPNDEEFSKWLQSSATTFPLLCTARLQGSPWCRDLGGNGEWYYERSD